MSLNTVNLVGRVGGDPELKWFEGSGKCVCTLTLAVNRRKKDSDPDWFSIKIWGKTGEIAKNYAKKGTQIGITGSLEIEEWIDKASGLPRSRPVIKADSLDLLTSKRDGESQGGYQYQ